MSTNAYSTGLERQVEVLVSSGFGQEVRVSDEEYRVEASDLVNAISDQSIPEGTILSLVEPRIPYRKQLELLGIKLDPAVLSDPKPPIEDSLYIALQRRFSSTGESSFLGYSLSQMTANLPDNLRPATPFEGIVNFQQLLSRGFVVFPGGDFSNSQWISFRESGQRRLLCLDTYLGQPRITEVYGRSMDPSIGVLTTVRSQLQTASKVRLVHARS